MSKNLFPPSFGTPAFLPMPKGRGFSRAFGDRGEMFRIFLFSGKILPMRFEGPS